METQENKIKNNNHGFIKEDNKKEANSVLIEKYEQILQLEKKKF